MRAKTEARIGDHCKCTGDAVAQTVVMAVEMGSGTEGRAERT